MPVSLRVQIPMKVARRKGGDVEQLNVYSFNCFKGYLSTLSMH